LGFFILNSLSYSHALKRTTEWDDSEISDTLDEAAPDSFKDAREHKADSIRKARERIADSTQKARKQKADSLQEARKDKADSLQEARKQKADSLQDARKGKTDSLQQVRKQKTDSLKSTKKQKSDSLAAIKKFKNSKHYKDSVSKARSGKGKVAKGPLSHTDSLKEARQQKTDSLQSARKRKTDSSAAIRKYRDSKHYKDSVTRSREKKAKLVKNARQEHMDSLKEARQYITDSLAASRKGKTDSVKKIQKRRTDSLAAKKKYRESKRYTDSVAVRKHDHLDSMKKVQQANKDRMTATRKHMLDSSKAVRKHSMDSLKTVRTKHMDSVKQIRKARTDSLAKKKADKEKAAKAKEKKKQEAMKLKLELKIKAKHEAWSNKSMLKKKWGPMRRLFQNSFTHYNYYFNARKKMEEAQVNMQRSRKENFDSLIGLYPFDPNRDSSLMLADMDSIIRKASVGIQIHDPRVKWSNDMYLLLGQAYYYKGSYEYASIAFRYIISSDAEAKKKKAGKGGSGTSSQSKDGPSVVEDEKKSKLNFLKHKSVHNEAILWLARTYTEAHQPENAESILSLLGSDAKLPKDLEGRLAVEKAFAFLMENNLVAATEQLTIASQDNNLPRWLRTRAAFINGQIQQNLGNYTDAANQFDKVVSYYPPIEMDFYARKYIAFNKLMAGENTAEAMKPLKAILHDAKYVNYYDQVYFVLGQLAVKSSKPDEAIAYFKKSATTPKATKKQKALSYVALGDVYYSTSDYTGAKRAYDSAAKYSSSASKDKGVLASKERSKGLEEISGPTRVIYEQDSLMDLSLRSKKEQLTAVQKYLRYLEKKQADSIRNAENPRGGIALVPEVEEDKGATDAPGNWYFGNATLMQQGSDDFKRKWGNRPLTDNWRRVAAINSFGNSNANNKGADNETDETGATTSQDNSALPSEASLLAKIPNTQAQKDLSAKVEQRAYMLLAKAYFRQLQDYPMAIHTLDTLDTRYPDHNQKEDELYLRYQIALKQNKLADAQKYSQELLTKFPNSQYANDLRPKQNGTKDDNSGKLAGPYFDETYNMILQHQYSEALVRIEEGKKKYDSNPLYKRRFQVAEAMAYAGIGDFDKADTTISRFLTANPSDTLTPWATTVKAYIRQVRNGGKPSWYYDTIPVAKRGVTKSGTTAAPVVAPPPPPPVVDIPSIYSYKADSEHYCIIVTPGVDSRTAALKAGIKKYNSKNDTTANLGMLFDLYNIDLGVFVIKKFPNAAQAKIYMDGLLASQALKDFKPGELQVYVITAQNYRKLFVDKNIAPYSTFFNSNYK